MFWIGLCISPSNFLDGLDSFLIVQVFIICVIGTVISEQSLEVNSINSRPELLGDSNAYEFLMKDALERKLSVCEVI